VGGERESDGLTVMLNLLTFST